METRTLQVKTPDGVADATLYKPDGAGPFPGVVYFIDAFGVRESTHEMCKRLASSGFAVLEPNLFYRAGPFKPFDPKSAFGDAGERDRVMKLIGSLTYDALRNDLPAYIDALQAQPGVKKAPVGLVGYCMGGRIAFFGAGAVPDKVGAAASIHGGHIATDAPDSPHLQAPKIKARLYFGIADNDRSCTPEQQELLKNALNAAHVRYDAEIYAGAQHGFAVPDHGVYNKDAAEKHWTRMVSLFKEAL